MPIIDACFFPHTGFIFFLTLWLCGLKSKQKNIFEDTSYSKTGVLHKVPLEINNSILSCFQIFFPPHIYFLISSLAVIAYPAGRVVKGAA